MNSSCPRRLAPLLLLTLLMAGCAGRSTGGEDLSALDALGIEDVPLQPVPYVDLDRYMGRWYMIANIPYFAEHGNLAPFVTYSRRADGRVDDLYTAFESFDADPFTRQGIIEITDPVGNAEGRISFLGPLWQNYAVLFLDADYRYTVIGHPSRDYAWVFAREPVVSDEAYALMLAALASNHFDVSRVLKIPQRPEQRGLAGFQ